MTKIYFFLRQFKNTIINNMVIYLIFLITISITVCSLVYLYSSSHAHIKNQIDMNSDYRTIFIDLSETPTKRNINNLIKNKEIPIDNIYMQGTLENDEIVCGEIKPYYYYNYGNGFNSKNTENAENVIMASSAYLLKNKEKQIVLNGVKYELVGEIIEPTNTVFKVPYTTLLDNFKVDKLMVILDKTFSAQQLISVRNLIDENNIKYNNIKMPNYEQEIQNGQQTQLIFISFIYIISLINFSYMFYYMLTKRKKDFFLYRIIGLSRKTSFIYIQCEVIFLFIISFICGVLLCKYLFNHILFIIWNIQPVDILLSDILIIFSIMLSITIVIMSTMILKFLNNKIILGLKESECE